MSNPRRREWRFYLDDMIDFAAKALSYTDGLDQAGFMASGVFAKPKCGETHLFLRRPGESRDPEKERVGRTRGPPLPNYPMPLPLSRRTHFPMPLPSFRRKPEPSKRNT